MSAAPLIADSFEAEEEGDLMFAQEATAACINQDRTAVRDAALEGSAGDAASDSARTAQL